MTKLLSSHACEDINMCSARGEEITFPSRKNSDITLVFLFSSTEGIFHERLWRGCKNWGWNYVDKPTWNGTKEWRCSGNTSHPAIHVSTFSTRKSYGYKLGLSATYHSQWREPLNSTVQPQSSRKSLDQKRPRIAWTEGILSRLYPQGQKQR